MVDVVKVPESIPGAPCKRITGWLTPVDDRLVTVNDPSTVIDPVASIPMNEALGITGKFKESDVVLRACE